MENFDDDFDVLINNAGVSVFKPFEDRTEEEIDYVYNVNLKGTILMSQAIFNKFFKNKIMVVSLTLVLYMETLQAT